MANENTHIIQLEEEVAHLTKANEELSSELHAQWKRIEMLERKFSLLEQRFTTFEDNQDTDPEDTRPPHW